MKINFLCSITYIKIELSKLVHTLLLWKLYAKSINHKKKTLYKVTSFAWIVFIIFYFQVGLHTKMIDCAL